MQSEKSDKVIACNYTEAIYFHVRICTFSRSDGRLSFQGVFLKYVKS